MPQTKRTVKGALGGLLGLVGLSAVAGVLVTATVTPALAMTGLAGSQAISLFQELPSYLEVNAPMEPTTIYMTNVDGSPVKLATFYDQNRVPVKFEQISPTLYDAVLSSEDKNYYEHGGVNLGATVKALVDNVAGTSSRGASTISQQYVKNVLVQECEKDVDASLENYQELLQQCWLDATNAEGNEGIERKLQEMRYAIQIEKDYSKNDILLGYLNIANFGGNIYGIEAAANYYFNTTAANLTIAQAATLAGIVQNPNTYRIDLPGGSWTDNDGVAHNGEADGYATALERRHYVLGRMLANGHITQEEYDVNDASPMAPAITPTQQGCAAAGSNAYFCQYVRAELLNDKAFGESKAERENNLRRGGMEVYTSLDSRIQNTAIEAMQTWAPSSYEGMQFGAAATTIENGTGRILAMVQNTTFSEEEAVLASTPGYSAQVYAADVNHGSSNGFPVGSTYKLFTLIDWLEKGHSVNEVLNGTNRLYTKMKCDDEPLYYGSKIVGNFARNPGYTGSVLKFTTDSLNSGYMAMAEKLDVCDINAVADRMGVTLGNGKKATDNDPENPSDDPAPFDVLGSKAIAPLQMAGAYATVANNGTYCPPKAIDRIVAQDGTDLPVPDATCRPNTIEPNVAATAAYALQRVMQSGGTGWESNPRDGVPVIGKTGTNNEDSTMMIESTTKTTTSVWVGNVQGFESLYRKYHNGTELSKLRHRITPMIQRAANEVYGGDAFAAPDRKLLRTVLTNVPSVVGMSIEEATNTLENADFQVSVGAPVDSPEPANIVATQDPGAGQAPAGSVITISPSNGLGASVPDVAGQSVENATAALRGAGFDVSLGDACRGGGKDKDDVTVNGTEPAAGTATTKGAMVSLSCSA